MQSFLRSQRDKILDLLQHSPPDLERIRDLYHSHLVGQFHVLGLKEWDNFWTLIDALHNLTPSFHAGSILFGGWKGNGGRLDPPTSISDQVIAFSDLPREFHDCLNKLWIYGEAVDLQRSHEDTHSFEERKRNRLKTEFEGWATDLRHFIFRPHDELVPSCPWDDSRTQPSLPPISMDEIEEFESSGLHSDLKNKVKGWVLRLSQYKAIHFLPVRFPSQGWKDFHEFCGTFNRLKATKNFRYYFLIHLPSA